MTITVELHPDAPFSLGAAAAFGFGPHTGRPKPDASEMRLGFVTDDLRHHAGVHLVQRPGGTVTAAIDSAAAPDAVLSQVRRIPIECDNRQRMLVEERVPQLGRSRAPVLIAVNRHQERGVVRRQEQRVRSAMHQQRSPIAIRPGSTPGNRANRDGVLGGMGPGAGG